MDWLGDLGLGKNMIGKLVRKTSEKYLLKWEKELNILVFHVNAHKRRLHLRRCSRIK